MYLKFYFRYFKSWISQISLMIYIKIIKLLVLEHKFTINNVLNDFVNYDKNLIVYHYKNNKFKFYNDVLYYTHEPKIDKYPNHIILFIGGRNSIIMNVDFSERLSEFLFIKVTTFQYSKECNFLSETTYLKSIEIIYNMLLPKYKIHIIGYSLGCFGAFRFNKNNSVFLISPFSSLEENSKCIIYTEKFNLKKEMENKIIKKVYVYGFNQDFINPIKNLTGPFLKSNIILKIQNGNHASGMSDLLFNDIKNYLYESINNFNITT